MNETLILALAWIAGGALGAIFYGGLWWTIRKGVASTQPALWFFGSLVLRLSIALPGFYFVFGGRWERLVLCLVGFTMARPAVSWLTRATEHSSAEARHAP